MIGFGHFSFRGLVLAVFLWAAGGSAFCEDARQAALAEALARNERLIESAHARLVYVSLPTDPAQVEPIKKACAVREDGPDEWRHFIIDSEFAAKYSYTLEWWRSGIKERVAQFQDGGKDNRAVLEMAFDGNVVKTLSYEEKNPFGSVDTVEGAGLSNTDRDTPFAFLHEFQMVPYSEIVARSPVYEERDFQEEGALRKEVRVRHPDIDSVGFVITFDEQGRILERKLLIRRGGPDKEYLCRVSPVFGDYRLVPCGGGNTVWFPFDVTYHYYMGPLVDGKPVEWMSTSVKVEEMEFNVPIPDETFSLSFPKDTAIYDGLTGAGWLTGKDGIEAKVGSEMAHTMRKVLAQTDIVHPAGGVGMSVAPEASAHTENDRPGKTTAARTPFAVVICILGGLCALACASVLFFRNRTRSRSTQSRAP